ncbi:MAG: hypothetical protein MZW92_07155 [Comamonadaceae bacterium]|nr:hypothetical protein [Comamonadaceae bacterium]
MTVDVTSGATSGSVALTYSNTYDVPASQAHVVGDWGFTKEGGEIVVNWSVAADGALTGNSTLGCTYDGSVRPRNATTAIFAVAVTETCTGGTKQLAGVGRLNADRTFLTFGLTTTGGAEAEAFVAAKE